MDIKAIADELVPAVKSVLADLSRLKGFNLQTLNQAKELLPVILKKVEVAGKIRTMTGAEKQELAIELVVRFRPAPWFLPDFLYRRLLAWVVDSGVAALKDRFEP